MAKRTIIRSNINALRGEQSLHEVADAIGVHFESLRRIAADKSTGYPKHILEKLCDHFGVTHEKLFVTELVEVEEKREEVREDGD